MQRRQRFDCLYALDVVIGQMHYFELRIKFYFGINGVDGIIRDEQFFKIGQLFDVFESGDLIKLQIKDL